jgi:hypothetical protein
VIHREKGVNKPRNKNNSKTRFLIWSNTSEIIRVTSYKDWKKKKKIYQLSFVFCLVLFLVDLIFKLRTSKQSFYYLSCPFSPFLLWLFWRRGLTNYLPWLTANVPISASQVAGMVGVSHQHSVLCLKNKSELDMVVHAYNRNTKKTDSRGSWVFIKITLKENPLFLSF